MSGAIVAIPRITNRSEVNYRVKESAVYITHIGYPTRTALVCMRIFTSLATRTPSITILNT